MNFHTFARYFGQLLNKQPRRKKNSRPAKKTTRRLQLFLETLEDRAVPTINTTPTIESFTPLDGSTVGTAKPTLQIVFSEEMKFDTTANTGAADPANYLLIDSSGNQFTIDDVLASNSNNRTTVTLSYNGNQDLIVDTYTLFVHGDRLFDVDDNRSIAPASKLVVANAGTNDLEVINILGDGTLNAVSQYPMPFDQTTPPNPNAVAFADLNADNLPDMIVANSTTNQLNIFLGNGSAEGFGFSLTPDRSLSLPAGTANTPKSIAIGDFNKDMEMDIAVANAATNDISVFLKIAGGTFDYNAAVNYAAGNSPRGLVATDLNGDGNIDFAVANNTISGINYTVSLLRGVGNGTFAAATNVVIGVNDTANNVVNGVHNPTDLAFGNFDNNTAPDLVVAGSNGVRILNNGSTSSTLSFTAGTILTTTATPSLTAGRFDTGMTDDVVASTTSGVVVFLHDGNGSFTSNAVYGPAGIADVVLADLNNDNVKEILLADNATPSNANVLRQVTLTGTITGATAANPIVITSVNHGLITGQRVTITGVMGVPEANGTFTITRINNDSFSLNGVAGTGTYVNGGTWTAVAAVAPVAGSPFSVEQGVVNLVVADTNGDGKQDFATANSTANTVTIYRGNGDLTFRQSQQIPVTPTVTRAVAVGDLNRDSLPDIVVVNNNGATSSSRVTLVLGQAGGGYSAPMDYVVATAGRTLRELTSVAIGDLNLDGLPDIAFTGRGSGGSFGTSEYRVGFLSNSISAIGGTLTTTSFTAVQDIGIGDQPTQIVLADFNNDNKLDMAVSHDRAGGFGNSTRRGISVRLNTSNGGNISFGNTQELASGTFASSLVAADFNNDNAIDIIATDSQSGRVVVRYGTGTGNFINGGTFDLALNNPVSIAAADFNADGFRDIVVASGSNSATAGGVSVLLSQLGTGFGSPVHTNVLPGTPLRNVVVSDLNRDGRRDILVSTATGTGALTADNVFSLYGVGDGTFQGHVPYLGGQPSDNPAAPTSYLGLTSNPLIRVTSFRSGGTIVAPDLVLNGGFGVRDLNGEIGNLVGWRTYRLPANPGGSHGQWMVQTGSTSPLSGETVLGSANQYQAMLDQADLIPRPLGGGPNPPPNPNPDSNYEGSHALYQDIVIPLGSKPVTLKLNLYLKNFANAWSDTTITSALDYRTAAANQQVRVDIMDPNGAILGTDAASGVLKNLFITRLGDALTRSVAIIDNDLTELQERPSGFASPQPIMTAN